MSSEDDQPITGRIQARPSFSLDKVRQAPVRGLVYRFVAGAFNARVGGIMLAFPAILAASLTLIAQEEDRAEAREDARGAVAGGCALALFAGVAALAFSHLSAAVTLLVAAAAWFAAALTGYLLAWFR
jgi:hypothetical protein